MMKTEAKTFNPKPFEETFTRHTAEVYGTHLLCHG
jgi:hypothetical protein